VRARPKSLAGRVVGRNRQAGYALVRLFHENE
jgi:hypothetical protein